MNYQRVREQAKLKALIKAKLLEKQDALKSMSGQERDRAEKLIIEQVKKDFKMGYKNAKQKSGKSERVQTNVGDGQDSTKTEGSETNESGSGEGSESGSEGSGSGSEETGSQDSSDNQETSNESGSGSELKLEEMNEEQLREYAKEKGIDLGNSSSINGMLKKINKASE